MVRLTKTFEYRRVRFLYDGQNLEQLVRNAWGQCGTQADRTIIFSDDRSSFELRSWKNVGENSPSTAASIPIWQGVGTITTTPAPEVEICERAPDPDENYLNSDMMALIRGNHVICMNCGRNAGSLRIYLQHLFRKAGFDDAEL